MFALLHPRVKFTLKKQVRQGAFHIGGEAIFAIVKVRCEEFPVAPRTKTEFLD